MTWSLKLCVDGELCATIVSSVTAPPYLHPAPAVRVPQSSEHTTAYAKLYNSTVVTLYVSVNHSTHIFPPDVDWEVLSARYQGAVGVHLRTLPS